MTFVLSVTAGTEGRNGYPGAKGERGVDGIPGLPGAVGAPGEGSGLGLPGPVGFSGPKGAPGTPGKITGPVDKVSLPPGLRFLAWSLFDSPFHTFIIIIFVIIFISPPLLPGVVQFRGLDGDSPPPCPTPVRGNPGTPSLRYLFIFLIHLGL